MTEEDIQHNLLVLNEGARQLLHDGFFGQAAVLAAIMRQAVDAKDHFTRETATLTAIEFFRDVIRNLPKEDVFLCEPA